LTAEGVALGEDVHDAEVIAVEHYQPGAGAQDGKRLLPTTGRQGPQWLGQALALQTERHGGGLTAWDDQAIQVLEVRRNAHLAHARAQALQNAAMRPEVALQGKHTYKGCLPGCLRTFRWRSFHRRRYQPR
jgi:hypothetical protein